MSKSKVGKIGAKSDAEEAFKEGVLTAGSAVCGFLGAKYGIKQVKDEQKGLVSTIALAAGLGLPAMVSDDWKKNKYFTACCNGVAMAGFEEWFKRNAKDVAAKFGIGSTPDYSRPTSSNPYLNYRTYTPRPVAPMSATSNLAI